MDLVSGNAAPKLDGFEVTAVYFDIHQFSYASATVVGKDMHALCMASELHRHHDINATRK